MYLLVIAVLLIALIVLLIVWASYQDHRKAICSDSDYPTTIEEDIAGGNAPGDVAYISSGILYHNRLPRAGTLCVPSSSDRAVLIKQPTFCKFVLEDGQLVTGRVIRIGAPVYVVSWEDGTETTINVSSGCTPVDPNISGYAVITP